MIPYNEMTRSGLLAMARKDARERDVAQAELARLRGDLEAHIDRLDEHTLNLPGWAMTCENVAIDLRHILDPEPPKKADSPP